MKTIFLHQLQQALAPCVATVGFFDGVHRGHQYLIGQMNRFAHEKGLPSTVVTFDRHPREVLGSDYQPRLLSTFEEKLQLLAQTGADQCVVLPFSREMAAMEAREFMELILRRRLNVERLWIGYDNRFGHNRSEGFDHYVAYGRELGIDVVRSEAFVLNGINVSSSVVRSFVEEGEVHLAAQCLGYPYTIYGKVVGGYQEGRKMGFPTANIQVTDGQKLIPAPGVYAVRAKLEDGGAERPAMMNIGVRPTFGGHELTLETHILNFSQNLYGSTLGVSFVQRIRTERRFESPAALSEQLAKDEAVARELFRKRTT